MSISLSRQKAWRVCESLGLPSNPHLPELDAGLALRSKEEISRRALALSACVAASYGFPLDKAQQWLTSQGLSASTTPEERGFLRSGKSKRVFQVQVESLYSFSWLLGWSSEIDWCGPIPESTVHKFPNLKEGESIGAYLAASKLRSEAAVIQALDLTYCLDWAVTELRLRDVPTPLSCDIKLRRKPLEWALSLEEWDYIPLDT